MRWVSPGGPLQCVYVPGLTSSLLELIHIPLRQVRHYTHPKQRWGSSPQKAAWIPTGTALCDPSLCGGANQTSSHNPAEADINRCHSRVLRRLLGDEKEVSCREFATGKHVGVQELPVVNCGVRSGFKDYNLSISVTLTCLLLHSVNCSHPARRRK